jgi:GntR family transcriptional regulator / MocR family aminotransferase
MPKRVATIPLTLPLRPAGVSLGRWLFAALRSEILEGRLTPGSRLPASRDLAAQYGLSRGTVVGAFEQLRSEGYVVGTVGSGTRVNAVLPEELLRARPVPLGQPVDAPQPPRALSSFARQVTLFRGYEPRTLRAFRANQPALDLFPIALWAKVAAHRLRRATPALLLGTEPLGYGPLREAVADYLRISRGVRCEAGQVCIVSGVQEALDLVTRLALGPGDRVCMEEPGYSGAARVFEAHGATVVPIPVDAEGITLTSRWWPGARLAYVTPAHQFPLGVAMSLPRRLALLEWARAAGALIFEDDYDAEFRYAGRPVPALQGLDRHGVVCFAGTFSKVLFPALRLGYLVVPPDLVDRVAAAKSVVSRHAPLLDQAVLCDFIADGHFGRHLRRMREVYAERLATLLEEGRARLAGLVEIAAIEAGLQTVGWLLPGVAGSDAERLAARRGVETVSLTRYARTALPREGLQLGFAAVDAEEIRRGVRELAVALSGERSYRSQNAGGSMPSERRYT